MAIPSYIYVHPKLRNPHNVTHSLISQNLKERIFVVQISLRIVIFLSLISQNMFLIYTTKEVNSHPHISSCVNLWIVTFLFFFLWHLLNVGACICHIIREGQVKGTTPLKCCTLCYSIVSHATLIL
jgi:hypothetical protein